jgi:xanthine dehydrogenase YagR molybdenum-binding subunit
MTTSRGKPSPSAKARPRRRDPLPETDTSANPAGVKGIGELGNVGTNAAVANAVFHATGVRLRSLPIRLEHLIEPPLES